MFRFRLRAKPSIQATPEDASYPRSILFSRSDYAPGARHPADWQGEVEGIGLLARHIAFGVIGRR